MVRDRSGGLHGNVSSHSYERLAPGSSLAIAGTSRINLLLKDYPVLIPGLARTGASRSALVLVLVLVLERCCLQKRRVNPNRAVPEFAPS